MRRLFIAINLSEDVKRELTQITAGINTDFFPRESAFRWLPPENWHLTISFLGEQPDEAIDSILKSIKETAQKHSNILQNVGMTFEKIILAPPGKSPRMIWLVGAQETSKILGEIKNELEDKLTENGVRFKRENRGFNAHLTLARFQPILGTSDVLIKDVRRPKIENISFIAQSLDLMESRLKRTGAEYEILTKLDFKQIN